jgi:PAS domain S-box-containing protein
VCAALSKPITDPDLLEAIIRSATDYAIISVDEQNRITSWSAGAETLLGWKAEEILGQSGARIFTAEDQTQQVPQRELEAARTKGRGEDDRWHVRKDGSHFWGSGVVVPLKEGAPPGFVKIIRDRTQEQLAAAALRRSERRFRTLVENIPQLVWRSANLGQRSWGSPQWETFTGLSLEKSVGLGWLEAIHPEDRDRTLEAWHEAERTGSLHVEHRTRRVADGAYRWFQTRGTRVHDEVDGDVEWLGTSTDVHDLRRALERQQVLIGELHHRTRNLLGIVNAISRQTLARAVSFDDFSERFSNRIAALGRVQTLVARTESAELSLRELVETEVRAHAPEGVERVSIEGPPVTLNEKAGETMALALHELATNAVKYGAFASPSGTLSIRWTTDEGALALEWRESGVQVATGTSGRGYGRELIEVALPFALGAKTNFDLRPDGLSCLVELPVHEWRQPAREPAK